MTCDDDMVSYYFNTIYLLINENKSHCRRLYFMVFYLDLIEKYNPYYAHLSKSYYMYRYVNLCFTSPYKIW
jgi:hypothetical protein